MGYKWALASMIHVIYLCIHAYLDKQAANIEQSKNNKTFDAIEKWMVHCRAQNKYSMIDCL